MRFVSLSTTTIFSLLCLLACGTDALAAPLSGQVSSGEEGVMEGVLVTVRRSSSPISTTVVTDAAGRFAFPSERLAPGQYSLSIRALGYELDSPSGIVLPPAGATTKLKLRRVDDLTTQLTNSEWLLSAPGSDAVKRDFTSCATCHTLLLPLMSGYNREQALDLLKRMAEMSSQAAPGNVQKRIVPQDVQVFGDPERLATFIASINRSTSAVSPFRLRGFDRPRGRATRVIITAYELPRRTIQPHDAVMGDDGYVWIGNFGENSLLRLDPKSGVAKEYPYPRLRPPPFANGNLDLEFDAEGYVWLALMNQTGVARFDRKRETFKFYPIPADMRDDETQQGLVAPEHSGVDSKIWVQAVAKPMITRLDRNTGQYEPWHFPFKSIPGFHIAYGVCTDSKNNAFLNGFANDYIWRIDAVSGEVRAFQTPTRNSRPRRGRMDAQDRLTFAQWWTDKVAVFDTRTETFREWDVPGYFPAPYDAEMDRKGWIWTDNTMDDRITRIDTKSGETIQYLLPIGTNARRISLDQYGPRPVAWVGSNHEAVVMKVEALD